MKSRTGRQRESIINHGVYIFSVAQNLYLSKAVDFSNHFLSSVTEGGDGPFGSRSSLGELYPSSNFKQSTRNKLTWEGGQGIA